MQHYPLSVCQRVTWSTSWHVAGQGRRVENIEGQRWQTRCWNLTPLKCKCHFCVETLETRVQRMSVIAQDERSQASYTLSLSFKESQRSREGGRNKDRSKTKANKWSLLLSHGPRELSWHYWTQALFQARCSNLCSFSPSYLSTSPWDEHYFLPL